MCSKCLTSFNCVLKFFDTVFKVKRTHSQSSDIYLHPAIISLNASKPPSDLLSFVLSALFIFSPRLFSDFWCKKKKKIVYSGIVFPWRCFKGQLMWGEKKIFKAILCNFHDSNVRGFPGLKMFLPVYSCLNSTRMTIQRERPSGNERVI